MQKKDVKQQLKALHLSHEPPAYVSDSDCDALLRGMGLPLSKMACLHVEWDGRAVAKSESFFSKTKAAHRCVRARVRLRVARVAPRPVTRPWFRLLRADAAPPARPLRRPASCTTSPPRRGRATTR